MLVQQILLSSDPHGVLFLMLHIQIYWKAYHHNIPHHLFLPLCPNLCGYRGFMSLVESQEQLGP